MKYQKPTVEVVNFNLTEFMAASNTLGACDTVSSVVGQTAVDSIGGDGHGACSGFAYNSTLTYYTCVPITRSGYTKSINCQLISNYMGYHCHVVN